MKKLCQNNDPFKDEKSIVYISRIDNPNNLKFGQKVAMQTAAATTLLQEQCQKLFGITAEKLNLRHLQSGKPVCDGCYCSVSHSGNFVAVAIGKKPVGVDLQRFSGAKIEDIAKKVFTEKEKAVFTSTENKTDEFYFIWCKKEALWKSLKKQPITVATVETTDNPFTLKKLVLDGENYYLAATGCAEIVLLQ